MLFGHRPWDKAVPGRVLRFTEEETGVPFVADLKSLVSSAAPEASTATTPYYGCGKRASVRLTNSPNITQQEQGRI